MAVPIRDNVFPDSNTGAAAHSPVSALHDASGARYSQCVAQQRQSSHGVFCGAVSQRCTAQQPCTTPARSPGEPGLKPSLIKYL